MKKYIILVIIVLVVYLVFFRKKNTSKTASNLIEPNKPSVTYDPITGYVVTDGEITGGSFVKPAGTSVTSAVPPLVPTVKDIILNGSYLET